MHVRMSLRKRIKCFSFHEKHTSVSPLSWKVNFNDLYHIFYSVIQYSGTSATTTTHCTFTE